MKTYTYHGLRWIESFSPTDEDLRKLASAESLDPFITKDILAPTPFAYAGEHGDALYAVFHFPVFRLSHSDDKQQELDLIIKDNLLMTIRYDSLEPLALLAQKVETHEYLGKHNTGTSHGAHLANTILTEMYKGVSHDLRAFNDWLHNIEDEIYTGKEREMVSEISLAARELTEFRSLIHEHEQLLEQIREIGTRMFNSHFEETFRYVMREFKIVQRQTKFLSELVAELRETNNSLVSTKQNEIMKVLTIMAFITFPLSLIASIFGMNVIDMPIVGNPNDFWVIVGIMGVGMLFMFIFFRYRKWL